MYFLHIGLSSDATVLTPNTESSCDLMTKTKSTSGNDDSTSLDLEWEDEEGIYSAIQFHSELKNADSFKYVDFKFVIFKREVDLKLNSDGISLKRVMIKL